MTLADYRDTLEGFQMRMELMLRSDLKACDIDTYMLLRHAYSAVFIQMIWS